MLRAVADRFADPAMTGRDSANPTLNAAVGAPGAERSTACRASQYRVIRTAMAWTAGMSTVARETELNRKYPGASRAMSAITSMR